MGSLYRRQLELWLSPIEVSNKTVLDIGGGQLPIGKRIKVWEPTSYTLLDNNSEYKPEIFHDLNYAYTKEIVPYEVIFCLEVFEYIFNPVLAHETIANFLKPGGVAYISYPTLYPLHNPEGTDYLRYTRFAIEKLLSETGFTTWEITPRMATEGIRSLADFYSSERMRPMKNTTEVFATGYLVKAYKEEVK